jgi:hypothetical protein
MTSADFILASVGVMSGGCTNGFETQGGGMGVGVGVCPAAMAKQNRISISATIKLVPAERLRDSLRLELTSLAGAFVCDL